MHILLPLLLTVFIGVCIRAPSKAIIILAVAAAVIGGGLLAVNASNAPEPKFPCWMQAKGWPELFRAVPFICQKTAR